MAAVLVCAGLGFIAALAWKFRLELATQFANLNVGLAMAATASLLVSNLGMGLIFSEFVQEETSADAGSARLTGTFLLSQIAKYVPGRVWGAVLQGVAVGHMLSVQRLIRINVDIAAIAVVVTGGAASAFIGWAAWNIWAGLLLLLLTIGLAYGVMVQRPSVRLHAFVARMIPKLRDDEPVGRRRGRAVGGRGIAGVVLFVLGYCIGWLALVLAVTHGPLITGVRLTSMLSVSYLVGLLSMLPAGLGVREAFLVGSAAWMQVDLATMTMLAIITRLAMVLVDLLSLPIAAVLLLLRRPALTEPR